MGMRLFEGLGWVDRQTLSVVRTNDLVEAVKRVALVAERNTPVRLRFSEGQVAVEAGTGASCNSKRVA